MVIGVGCGSKLKKEASPNPSCFHGPSTWPLSDLPRASTGRGTEAGTGRNGVAGMGGPSGLVQGGAEEASMDRVERVEKIRKKK